MKIYIYLIEYCHREQITLIDIKAIGIVQQVCFISHHNTYDYIKASIFPILDFYVTILIQLVFITR